MIARRFSFSSFQASSRLTKSRCAACSALPVLHAHRTRSSISEPDRLPMIRVCIEIAPDAGLEILQQSLDGRECVGFFPISEVAVIALAGLVVTGQGQTEHVRPKCKRIGRSRESGPQSSAARISGPAP